MSQLVVAFDVDGTLLNKTSGYEDTPNYSVLQVYFWHRSNGAKIIIWSGCGKDCARAMALKLGLKHRFEDTDNDPIIMEKPSFKDPNRLEPDITYDDEIIKLGKVNIQV